MAKSSDLKGIKAVVLTISDTCSAGKRKDESGDLLVKLLEDRGALILKKEIIPDEESLIRERFEFFSDIQAADVIFSTGGTGLGERDVTPEATKSILTREIPGLSELMRSEGFKKTKRAVLSRSVAGIRGKTLIVNLPGSPRGAAESLDAIIELIPHALSMMRGEGHP